MSLYRYYQLILNLNATLPTHNARQNSKKKKQEAHGPHRSPEKTVQIIKQIWLYHNADSENKEKNLWEFIGSSFEQTWNPFTQGCFVPSLVEIDQVVLEKKMKMWKVYRQTDGQTDRRRTTGDQKKAHLSFQLRWAKYHGASSLIFG